MEKTIFNPNSPLYQKIKEYSSMLSEVYSQIVPLSDVSENNYLKPAVQVASKRAQQSILVDSENCDENIEYRN